MSTILEVINSTVPYFQKHQVDSPRLQIELLLAHVLKIKRLELYLQFDRPLKETELSTLRELVRRRAKREPLQYLMGTANFRGLELKVTPQVLIPRPETEELVEHVLQCFKDSPPSRILDIGTGSGAIIISLAKHWPDAVCYTTDMSEGALEVAKENASKHGVAERISFRRMDLWPDVDEPFDLIVSNPPYIASDEISSLQPEVALYEPVSALDGGPTGLDYIQRIVIEAKDRLADGGFLALEMGHDHFLAVSELMKNSGYGAIRIIHDLQKVPRFAIGKKRA